MANMSYCRFRNTLSDYSDCVNALEHYMYDGEDDVTSDEELKAARQLLEMSFNILDELGVIKDDSLDHEELDIFFERLKDGCQ
jgi:hypothetical protein